MSIENTIVNAPLGTSVYPGHVSHQVLGSQQGRGIGVVTSVLRPNIPGVDLRQTAEVNGVLVDVHSNAIVR